MSFLGRQFARKAGAAFLLAALFLSVFDGDQAYADRIRQAPTLQPLWARLDAARAYRAGFKNRSKTETGDTGQVIGKSHQAIIADYKNTLFPGLNGKSPKQEFEALVGDFTAKIDTVGAEAEWGLQEALNEVMQGQLLLGNQKLLEGLRARFPGSGPVGDQVELLTQSVNFFQAGIDKAIDELRNHPERLRAGSDDASPFPVDYFVENSSTVGQGDPVENEMYRFTDLVNRLGLAGNSRAKRKYFFGNASPAGREEAAQLFKTSAQATYLHSVVLAAVQRRDQFQNNTGYELKRQVLDAQRLFEDIRAGFNPLKLRGDFIPPPELGAQGVINFANGKVTTAITDEAAASNLVRDIDQLETSLSKELFSLQEIYLDQIATTTGIDVDTLKTDYDLLEVEDRESLLADAEANMRAYQGTLGQRLLELERAALDAKQVQLQLQQIPDKISLEERTNNEINKINLGLGKIRGALSLAEALANSYEICACGLSTGVITRPSFLATGVLGSAFKVFESVQQGKISGIVTGKRVQELLMEASLLAISLESAGKAIEERKAQLEIERVQLQRLVRNYASADVNLSNAYFSNPAYRLQSDNAREEAEGSFEGAMISAYEAAKALEFDWSERVKNPVEQTNGGSPVPLGSSFDGIVSAESVFAAHAAGAAGQGTPTLKTFMNALKQWDFTVRSSGMRPTDPSNNNRVWSLRRDLLGFNSPDEAYNRILFADYIAKHRVVGQNQAKKDLAIDFAVSLGTNSLLPGALATQTSTVAPNLKITSLAMNMSGLPFRSLIGSGGGPLEGVDVTLELSGTAMTRTFFARIGDDDMLGLDLPGARNGDQSPVNALVTSRVQGQPVSVGPQPAFVGLSPAVSRWSLKVDMSEPRNANLILENLDDIAITVNFRFGRPPQLVFQAF